jgi:hypothetical protein
MNKLLLGTVLSLGAWNAQAALNCNEIVECASGDPCSKTENINLKGVFNGWGELRLPEGFVYLRSEDTVKEDKKNVHIFERDGDILEIFQERNPNKSYRTAVLYRKAGAKDCKVEHLTEYTAFISGKSISRKFDRMEKREDRLAGKQARKDARSGTNTALAGVSSTGKPGDGKPGKLGQTGAGEGDLVDGDPSVDANLSADAKAKLEPKNLLTKKERKKIRKAREKAVEAERKRFEAELARKIKECEELAKKGLLPDHEARLRAIYADAEKELSGAGGKNFAYDDEGEGDDDEFDGVSTHENKMHGRKKSKAELDLEAKLRAEQNRRAAEGARAESDQERYYRLQLEKLQREKR